MLLWYIYIHLLYNNTKLISLHLVCAIHCTNIQCSLRLRCYSYIILGQAKDLLLLTINTTYLISSKTNVFFSFNFMLYTSDLFLYLIPTSGLGLQIQCRSDRQKIIKLKLVKLTTESTKKTCIMFNETI